MQGKYLYEYAVLRIVPRVEREEFINVGVLVSCKKEGFLKAKISMDVNKVKALDPDADIALFDKYLESLNQICIGNDNGSPIALQDATSRFRWLTANRSSMIQTSQPHGGFSEDLEATLEELFCLFVS
ncbi:DUF3037 domain-containing protein [Belliella sp. DSM 107340]|uniref:DUF3037 domain-containing protein n=1 Tax=Belliella calami TaxID=2923436 RepID=A0ABS9UU72_9BACT|nr:DUF3037 domain-containing protein [Belliella calami]MCH7399803.1 DUF3037 domain-containing protein [Belliella calami]